MGKPGRDRAPSPVNQETPPPGSRCVMKGPPLGPGGEAIIWPDQVAPRGQKASSTRKIKLQTSNLEAATNPATGISRPGSEACSLRRTAAG